MRNSPKYFDINLRIPAGILVLSLLVLPRTLLAQGQSNLLVNGGFDHPSTPTRFYYDNNVNNTGTNTDVPGWEVFANEDTSSWLLISEDDNSPGNWRLDLSGSDFTAQGGVGLAGIQTAVSDRPSVKPLADYIAEVTYDNYYSSAGISYFIDWFDENGDLIESSGGGLGDPNGPGTFEPDTQLFEIEGTAPASATYAGLRFQSENGSYAGATADNFRLTRVLPTPPELSIARLPNGSVKITFTGALKRSASVKGQFQEVPGNPRGSYVISKENIMSGTQFFQAEAE